jgi:hypothetical protein
MQTMKMNADLVFLVAKLASIIIHVKYVKVASLKLMIPRNVFLPLVHQVIIYKLQTVPDVIQNV